MLTTIRYVVILSLCLFTGASAASPEAARLAFKQLYAAIENGRVKTETDAVRALRDYPLYPYLRFALVREHLRSQPGQADDEVHAFLRRYPSLAPSNNLRNEWLRSLARRGRWQKFLAAYRSTGNRNLRCDAVAGRIALNRVKGLVDDAMALWYVGYSQPRACDPVFAWLKARGELTGMAIRKRLNLAMHAGHYHLASYLADKLTDADRARVAHKINLFEHPAAALERLVQQHDRTLPSAAIASALYRLAISKPTSAADLLPRLASGYSLSGAQRQRLRGRIALGFALDHDARALDWFARVDPDHLTKTTRAWRIRAALYQGRWSDALSWIGDLPKHEFESARWQYWRARALAQTGDTETARAIYDALSRQLGFYAYLAAGHSAREYQPTSTTITPDPSLQARVLHLPGVIRAHELFEVGLTSFAREEWRHAMYGRPDAEQRQAALLASQWGWHSQSIRALVRGGGGKDLDLRYPTAFSDAVLSYADELALKPAWIYGVMRSESLFQPDVRSGAGAIGLMQLMPATARQVAAKRGIELTGLGALLDPQVNVGLGTSYLRTMVDRFGGSLVAATAAYNAGPNRVSSWLPDKPIAADVWVENIPYIETRHYVQRVLAYTAIFEWRLNEHVPAASLLMQPIRQPGPETIARAE